jgi:hypothetical protein
MMMVVMLMTLIMLTTTELAPSYDGRRLNMQPT